MMNQEMVNFLSTSALVVSLCSLGNALIWFAGIFATAAPSKMRRWERGMVCFIHFSMFLSLFFTRGVDGLIQGVIRFTSGGGESWLILLFEVWRVAYIVFSVAFWIWIVHILRRDYTQRP